MKNSSSHRIHSSILCVFIFLIIVQCSSAFHSPSIISQREESTTWYVGGNGSGNYTRIQDAIDNASENDTIKVFSGTYYEHLHITKSLILLGESTETTIVDGQGNGDVVCITAQNVFLSCFTIQHCGSTALTDAGIELQSQRTIIVDCIIRESGDYAVGIYLNSCSQNYILNTTIYKNGNEGIYLMNASENIIRGNTITHNNHCAIVLSSSSHNSITHNRLHHNGKAGISFWPDSTENTVMFNTITDNPYSGIGMWPPGSDTNLISRNILRNNTMYGIHLVGVKENRIIHNSIQGSTQGVLLINSSSTVIRENNFLQNTQHAFFENCSGSRWRGNYWDTHQSVLPKLIGGTRVCLWAPQNTCPWANIDWRPSPQMIS